MTSEGIISIPTDLITEILYRLPSKSVGRFRCVSKEWLSLLTSPQFIKTHQNTLNQKYVFNYEEIKEEELIPTNYEKPIVYNSCCGLVLLSALRLCSGHETFIVSNLTTREFVELPDCDIKIEGYKFVSCIMRELGYDSVTDDYKVVTIIHFVNNLIGHDIMCVHVYSLRRNTWTRVIDYPDKYWRFGITSEAFVNGSFHWVAIKDPDETEEIVAFSLADENFSEMPLPTLRKDFDITCRLCVIDDKLAVFSGFYGKVWLMNEYGVNGSWTNKIKLHRIKEIRMSYLACVLYVNGKLLVVYHKEMHIYDVEDGRLLKRVDIYEWPCVRVESLVSPRLNRLD